MWPWSGLRLLAAKRRIRSCRVITLGVLPEHRRAGLEMVLIAETIQAAGELRYVGGECSWVLDDNATMIAAIEKVGGHAYRRYRLYEKPL